MFRAVTAGVMLVLMAGCNALDEERARQQFIPQTDLEMIDPGTLRVTYTLQRPANLLAFQRVPDGQRAERWQPLEEGFRIVHDIGGKDYISKGDGEFFSSVSFDVPATYINLPKDYAPFMPFTDGGIAIYSGRFHTCVRSCGITTEDTTFPMRLKLGAADHIILDAEIIQDTVEWDDLNNGTMVYLGSAEPVETADVIGVVDPGLPQDIQDALETVLPQFMGLYTERLGPLREKPMLFASMDRYTKPDGNPSSNDFSAQGGTLPGQIFMHLEGDGWLEAFDVRGIDSTAFIAWFFAHEAAHLHQRRVEVEYDMAESWIHEGGADAKAALALDQLGAAPASYITLRKQQAIDTCLFGLETEDLRSAGERGAFDLYYSCGMIMQLAADRVMKERGTGDLFTLWSAFIEALEAGAAWDEETFLSLMEEMTDAQTRQLADDLLDGADSLSRGRLTVALGLEQAGEAGSVDASARSGAD